MSTTTRIIRRLLLLPLGLLAWQGCEARQAARTLYVVEQEDIDPALAPQYEEGVQLAVAAMQEANLGSDMSWVATQYQSSYFYVFQVGSLGEIDLDSPQAQARNAQLATAMDEATFAQFATLTTPAIRGNHLSVMEPVPEYSYEPADSVVENPQFNHVVTLRVQAARVEQFEQATAEIIAAIRESAYPIGFNTYRTVIGDGRVFFDRGRTYYFIVPFDSRSQFYEEHPFGAALEEAVGAERAAQLLGGQLSSVVTMETHDYRLRPDMSYQAAR